jgi:hypothetical protein
MTDRAIAGRTAWQAAGDVRPHDEDETEVAG